MAYDYNVNMNEMYAPVQTNIVIRSKSGKNSKKNTESKSVQTSQKKNIIASNGQRIDINKFTNFLQGISSYRS